MMDDLYKEVSRLIADDPLCIPEIMRAVNDGFAAFVAAERVKRETTARAAVGFLMAQFNPESPPSKSAGGLIDAAYHQFPNGPVGLSGAEEKFWSHFVEVAKEGVDKRWVLDSRGIDCLEWCKNPQG